MTTADIEKMPHGTTHFSVRANAHAFQPWNAFKATHLHNTPTGVEIKIFHGATQADALGKAAAYDRELKETKQ